MRKLNLTAQRLQALYPPTSQDFHHTVQNTLHDLAQRKEQPVMKKKISAALVVAVILILLMISAAIALTQSNLVSLMFGKDATVPKELQEAIEKPEATVTAAGVAVTLNEYLYDGEKLHLQWAVSNTTGRQVMVTMSRFQINGQYVNVDAETSFQSTDHTSAYILGGDAEDSPMPVNVNCFGTFANLHYGEYPLKRGEMVDITCDLYLWELLNPPALINDSSNPTKEEYARLREGSHLPTDRNGLCNLNWFVADEQTIDVYTGEDYRRAYEKLGWAKLTAIQPVKFTITLEPKPVRQVQPAKTTFEMDSFTLIITRMVYMQTGGTMYIQVYPKNKDKPMNENHPLYRDLIVLNADTMEFLNGGRSRSSGSDLDYFDYQIELEPVSGNMPAAILITPSVVKNKWDWTAEHDLKRDRWYTYTLEDVIRVELVEQP